MAASDGFMGFNFDERFDRIDRFENFSDLNFTLDPVFLIMLGLLILSLWVIFWIMSVMSEGSLIHGISKKELGLYTDFSDCWNTGWKGFLRLFGIILLITLSTVIVVLGCILFLIPVYILSVAAGIILTIFAIPIVIAAIIVAVSVEGWAMRYAVLNNETWLEAITKGWLLLKDNIWKTVAIALLSLLTQIVLWFSLIIGLIIMAIPFIILGYIYIWLGLIPGIFILFLVIILSSAYFGTFASSFWTLGFMALTNYRERFSTPDSGYEPQSG